MSENLSIVGLLSQEKFLKFLNDFFDNLPLARTILIFLLLNSFIKFGQISVSIKIAICGIVLFRKNFADQTKSTGKKQCVTRSARSLSLMTNFLKKLKQEIVVLLSNILHSLSLDSNYRIKGIAACVSPTETA